MDFVSYIRDQSEKLRCRDYVLHLWHELEGNTSEIDVTPNSINDFNNHQPLLLEQFWEIALEKLECCPSLDDMDEDLKVYLLVLIYQCITQSYEAITFKCVTYACKVYLNLLILTQGQDFFKSKLYTNVLTTLQTCIETVNCEHTSKYLMQKLHILLKTLKLKDSDLEITLATLMQIVFFKSEKIFKSYDELHGDIIISHEALISLKTLLVQETIPSRKFLITTYLFNGLRKSSAVNLTPSSFTIIQMNLRNLIKNLHSTFKQDHYKTFLNAFIYIWKHPEFCFYGEAVSIMNSLKEKHYRTLIDILHKMMMSKNSFKNLFKLSLAVICCPPKYSTNEKIEVTNEILLRSIVINCLSTNSETSHIAVNALAEILTSPDLQKSYINQPFKAIINKSPHTDAINALTLLNGLKKLMSKKWTSRSRNKNLFVIVISVMSMCNEDYSQHYAEILEILSEESTPFELKPFLPILSETYMKLIERNHEYSAFLILKIIFRMAIHPMASSTEFVKHLYVSMTSSTIYKGRAVNTKIFIDHVISGEFNFSEFFQKCHTLGLIKNEHVSHLMGNLASNSESHMKLLSSIVHLTDYKDLSAIANHINKNFMVICNSQDLKYLFYVYNRILKNSNSLTHLHQNLRSNEIMTCFIKHHLLKQSFRWDCVSNAFALLKSLEEFTDLNEDFRRLKQEYDQKLTLELQNRTSFIPLLYYSQLVMFGKVVPNEENLSLLKNFLKLFSNELYRRSPECNSKLWIGSLILYTSICVIKTNLVEMCMNFLKYGLDSSLNAVKLASINLTFDLCNMVSHSFEELISYMFDQLVYADSIFKKTCLLKIDRLIRDDYLKLDLTQFVIFVSILGDRNLCLRNYLQQLLSEHFFISNTSIIAKYFVPLIVYINGYKKHPMYEITEHNNRWLEVVLKNVLDRRKIYSLLFNCLPVKGRFNIIYILATNILENMMKGTLKCEDGFWNMIKDSIFIYKLVSESTNEEISNENFYKKVAGQISKNILEKGEISEKRLYPEFQKEIVQSTETLLKLLFYNDSINIQKHLRISVFDAIMHWTNFFLAELVHVIHVERCLNIQNYYLKVNSFFKKNGHSLRYTEETFESGDRDSHNNFTITSTSSLFNINEGNVSCYGDQLQEKL